MSQKVTSLSEHFSRVDDPRVDRTKQHLFIDILVIAIYAVICGADDWVVVAAFGRAKPGWVKSLLRLPNGIPSPDTFGRVFARLDPQQFQQAFAAWIQAISDLALGQIVAIDGKKLRRNSAARTNAYKLPGMRTTCLSFWRNKMQLPYPFSEPGRLLFDTGVYWIRVAYENDRSNR